MKSLFDENEKYTQEANRLSDEVNGTLKSIFEDYLKRGYKSREIEAVMAEVVQELSVLSRL